ncbi:MAG TPA: Spy/CpxP family protein refolding chaperone, partial [Xanthobacteraceae bacterium]|nr:Spy/CpxP family protein refolding chaperone [Xanthobacteraceae bacterium]
AKFYDSLSDDQKVRFSEVMPRDQDAPRKSGQPNGDAAQFCDSRQSSGLTDQAVQRIAEVVRPTDEQRRALEQLQDAAAKAAEVLRSACPAGVPADPVARLDVLEKRIEAMLQALRIERPALSAFYNSLSDQQRARFNTLASQQG